MGSGSDYADMYYRDNYLDSNKTNINLKEKFSMTNKNKATQVVTGEVRFSYLHVFQPHAVDPSQQAKYSVSLLIPKSDTATLNKIKQAIENAKIAGQSVWGGKTPPNLKMPIRDGDVDRPDQPEYAGHYFINANSTNKPGIVDQNVNEIIDSTELYSGCYGRADINFYAYNKNGNRGIACGLNNLQKTRDGETLGGRARAEDVFEPVAGGDSAADAGMDDFLA